MLPEISTTEIRCKDVISLRHRPIKNIAKEEISYKLLITMLLSC